MKQLGNLAVICAQRPELLMQLRGGLVLVQAKNRAAMEAAWNDDARIEKMIYELNFGAFSPRKGWCKEWSRASSREYGN